jgi:uncharacterized integral membrane protein
MRKFSLFLIVLLIVLIASLSFVVQNSTTNIDLKFLFWAFPSVSVGLFTILLFLAGVVSMWLISLMLYIGSSAKYRREVKDRDNIIKALESDKIAMKKESETKSRENDEKLKELQTKIKELEEKIKSRETVNTASVKTEEIALEKKETGEPLKEETSDQLSTEEAPKKRGFFRRNK